jgi:hypothetical protein
LFACKRDGGFDEFVCSSHSLEHYYLESREYFV